MAFYDGLLQRIYPERTIECWLIWVDTLRHEVIETKARNKALAQFFGPNVLGQ